MALWSLGLFLIIYGAGAPVLCSMGAGVIAAALTYALVGNTYYA